MKRKRHSVKWYRKKLRELIRWNECLADAGERIVWRIDLKEEESHSLMDHLTATGVRRDNSNAIREILGLPQIDDYIPRISDDRERKAWVRKRELTQI